MYYFSIVYDVSMFSQKKWKKMKCYLSKYMNDLIINLDAGFIQEWLTRAWVWSTDPRWPKTDRRICDNTHVWDWIKPFQVVGLRCSIYHSHMLQDFILYYSQVQGKSITIISRTLCKKNLTPAWEKTFFQENVIFSFHEA